MRDWSRNHHAKRKPADPGPNARITANVVARDVVVQGSLQGDIHAAGRVELRTGSHVNGDIRAARLSVEDNAVFSGKVELDGSAAAEGGRGASRMSPSFIECRAFARRSHVRDELISAARMAGPRLGTETWVRDYDQ